MKKYILLDLDGTLTNSLEGIGKCLQYALEAFGVFEPDIEALRCYIGPPLMDTFMNAYGFSAEQAVAATAKYRERYNTIGWMENEVYDGIKEALERLRAAGMILIAATSKPETQAVKIMEYFGLAPYFQDMCGADSDPAAKRNHKDEVIRYALEKNNITDKGLVMMVGDTKYDMQGAKQCGIEGLGVLYGFGTKEELEEAGAALLAETPIQMAELLLAL